MKKYLFTLTIVFALIVSWAGANATAGLGAGASSPALKKKIETLTSEMEAAYRDGNMLKVASYFADDATIMLPNGTKVQGRKAISQFWMGTAGAKDLKLDIIEVGGTADMIYHLGKATITTEQEGQLVTQTSDFVMLWKKQSDWTYKIYVQSTN